MIQPLKLHEALRWASSFLREHGYEETIAPILLMHYLQIDRTTMFQRMQEDLSAHVIEQCDSAFKKVVTGVPVQYITGVEHFYGREFMVNENVLIPRPETEELVQGLLERVKKVFPRKQPVSIVDIGTGSGAISVSLKAEFDQLNVTAVDISVDALEVAKQNAKRHGTTISFLQGDLLSPVINEGHRFDVVVSNPPYISEGDFQTLATNVKEYEPKLALVGGHTGYELYGKIVEQLPAVINKTAIVAFEVGVGQTSRVAAMLETKFPSAQVDIVYDINGKDRMVFAIIEW